MKSAKSPTGYMEFNTREDAQTYVDGIDTKRRMDSPSYKVEEL